MRRSAHAARPAVHKPSDGARAVHPPAQQKRLFKNVIESYYKYMIRAAIVTGRANLTCKPGHSILHETHYSDCVYQAPARPAPAGNVHCTGSARPRASRARSSPDASHRRDAPANAEARAAQVAMEEQSRLRTALSTAASADTSRCSLRFKLRSRRVEHPRFGVATGHTCARQRLDGDACLHARNWQACASTPARALECTILTATTTESATSVTRTMLSRPPTVRARAPPSLLVSPSCTRRRVLSQELIWSAALAMPVCHHRFMHPHAALELLSDRLHQVRPPLLLSQCH